MSDDQDPGLDREMVALVAEVKRLIARVRQRELEDPLTEEDRLPPPAPEVLDLGDVVVVSYPDGSMVTGVRRGGRVICSQSGPDGEEVYVSFVDAAVAGNGKAGPGGSVGGSR